MLVLQRGIDQDVVISHPVGDVRVAIVAVDGGLVKLGFDAPDGVRIYRKEIYDSIQRGESPQDFRNRRRQYP